MKVITDEKLAEVFRKLGKELNTTMWCVELVMAMEELDQLTVSKLRPMSEASGRVMAYMDGEFLIIDKQGKYSSNGHDNFIVDDELDGWIPLPEYIPEQT